MPDDFLFHATEYVVPVLGGRDLQARPSHELSLSPVHPQGPRRLQPGFSLSTFELSQLYGTAFPIGAGWFLTAAHVVQAVIENPCAALGWLNENDIWESVPVTEHETLDCDVGLLKANVTAKTFPWALELSPQLDDVQAIGYAYGWDEEASFISPRGFKGHIAGLRQSLKWAQHPFCYELSFQAPRGLSGAPVWGGKHGVIGMILGNSSTEMVVFSEREVLSEGKEHTFEKVEALHLGFALSASAAVQLHSAHIGMTLGEHFRRCGLLAKARQPTARRAKTPTLAHGT
jgi:hypothetical protein